MRNINAELLEKSVIRCPECGDRINNHQVLIQRHFLERHNLQNQLIKREKDWKFQIVAQIKNPLSLRNIFGRA